MAWKIFWALTLVVAMARQAASNEYTDFGPYSAEHKDYTFHLLPWTGCKSRQCQLSVTITKPSRRWGSGDENNAVGRSAPFPVVVFFGGFQMRLSYYKDYADHMASWGFLVVQYDTPFMSIITDKVELQFLDPLLDWLKEENNKWGGFVHDIVDLSRLGLAGHSRGGKLSALHLSENPRVKAAYLIDPVDSDNKYAPEGPDYPSAAKALAGKNKIIGVVGSGKIGSCNPKGSNYVQFWNVGAQGSWLTIVDQCTHSQFINAPPMAEALFDMLCGRGKDSCREVIDVTRPGLVAWMDRAIGATRSTESDLEAESLLEEFFSWVERMEKMHIFNFTVKNPDNQIETLPSQPFAMATR